MGTEIHEPDLRRPILYFVIHLFIFLLLLLPVFSVCLSLQVCVYCDGSPRPAANGLPLSEYQPVCGEFPEDGAKTPGG